MGSPSDTQAPVTVVIPVYNRSGLIGRCLDSVRAQTFRPIHIIVVDNNSTDDTAEVVRKWSDLNSTAGLALDLLSETRKGASAARNRGLEAVTTPYTCFFDSDDEMHPDLIASAMSAIGDADIVYWQTAVIGLDGVRRPKPFHKGNLLLRQIYNAQFSTQQYLGRTELFRKVGGWNPEAMVWNDWEIGIRLMLTGPRVVALPQQLVTIHAQRESITGTRFHDRRGDWEHTVAQLERFSCLTDYLRYIKATLAAHYRREGFAADADALLREATAGLPLGLRWWLRLLHHYTARGGRGAYYAWSPTLLLHRNK